MTQADETNKLARLALIIVIIVATTLLYVYLLSKDLVRPGGFSPEWNWGRRELDANSIPNLGIIYEAGIFTVALTILSWLSLAKLKRAAVYMILPLLVLLAFYLYLGITIEANYNFHSLLTMLANRIMLGSFEDAARTTNPMLLLTEFESIKYSFSGHSMMHPPGVILLFWLIILLVKKVAFLGTSALWLSDQLHINREYLASIDTVLRDPTIYKAAVWSALLIPFVNFLAAIPTYVIGKTLFNTKVGVIAAFISLSVPAYFLIAPQLDPLFVLPVTTFVAAYLVSLKKDSISLMIVSSLLFVVSYFFTVATALMIPIAFLLTAVVYGPGENTGHFSRDVLLSLKNAFSARIFWYSIITVAIIFLLLATLGVNLFSITISILRYNSSFNETGRSYFYWIFYNLYDFFFFLGIPTAALFLLHAFSNRSSDFGGRDRILAVLVLAFVIILDATGINRGEVARLWIIFMPLFILGASVALHEFGKYSDTAAIFLIVAVVTMQIFQTTAFRMYLVLYNLVQLPFFHYPITWSGLYMLHFLFP